MTEVNTNVSANVYQQKANYLGDALPVMVNEMGPNANHWQPSLHCHSEMEFQLVCQGSCQYFIHDTNYMLTPGFLSIMHPEEIHAFIPCENEDLAWRKIALLFSMSIFENQPYVADLVAGLKNVHCLSLPTKQVTVVELLLMEIIEEYKNRKPFWQEAICNSIIKFLTIIYRLIDEGINTKLIEPDPIMQEVLAYLDKHFNERQSLIDVAAIFGMSQYYLSRRFKEYTGLGFRDYIINRRIVESKKLLKKTDLKITAVALKAGFDDLSTFYRDFRLATGISPSSYRKISE